MSEYTCSHANVNLNSMVTFKDYFGMTIGFSDHTTDEVAAITAIELGAEVIEKHFTFDRTAKGPDHAAYLNFNELGEFVSSVRKAEKVLEALFKTITDVELENAKVVKKRIVTKTSIDAGAIFTNENLKTKGVNKGINTKCLPIFLGRCVCRNFSRNSLLDYGDIS